MLQEIKADMLQEVKAEKVDGPIAQTVGRDQIHTMTIINSPVNEASPQFVPIRIPQENHIGREQILANLVQASKSHNRLAIWGLTGIGKSCLAAAFLRKMKDQKWPTFWVHADTFEHFEQSYKTIARKEKIEKNPEFSLLYVVKEWLENPERGSYYIVLDDAGPDALNDGDTKSTEQSFCQWLPELPSNDNSIRRVTLMTTRNRTIPIDWDAGLDDETIFKIKCLKKEEACILFKEKTKGFLENVADEDVETYVEKLDYHPSAIILAAAFIRKHNIKTGHHIQEYFKKLTTLDTSHLLEALRFILPEDPDDCKKGQPCHLVSILQSTLNEIPFGAIKILALMSCLDRIHIPERLVTNAFNSKPSDIGVSTDLAILCNYALIEANRDSEGGYAISGLIQEVVRAWLQTQGKTKTQKSLGDWHLVALESLWSEYTKIHREKVDDIELVRQQQWLLPHIDMFRRYCQDDKREGTLTGKTARAIICFSDLYAIEERHKSAVCILRFVLDKLPEVKKACDSQEYQRLIMDTRVGLAKYLTYLARIDEDSTHLHDAFNIAKSAEAESKCDEDRMKVCSVLALIYGDLKDFKLALKNQNIVVAERKKRKEEEAACLEFFEAKLQRSRILYKQGMSKGDNSSLDSALDEQKEILKQLREREFSNSSRIDLQILGVESAMARTYFGLKHFQDAKELAEKVFKERSTKFSEIDKKTINSGKDLSTCLVALKHYEEAINVLQVVKKGLQLKFGPKNKRVIKCQQRLEEIQGLMKGITSESYRKVTDTSSRAP